MLLRRLPLVIAWCVTVLIMGATAAATAQAPSQESPAQITASSAEPAVWKLIHDETTIWFVGTYHFLPPDLDWRSAPVRRALQNAETLYLEADIESAVAQTAILRGMITQGFLPRGTFLRERLTRAEVSTLMEICAGLNLSFKAIDVMRPWNAFTTLSAHYLVAKGFDPNSGVDRAINLEVEASNRPIKYFETAAQQLGFLSSFSEEVETSLIKTTIRDWDKADEQFTSLFEAWRTGDAEEMDTQINIGMKDASPRVFDVLLVQRNRNWVTQIEKMVEQPQTVLIAVGAGHLVGDQSVIAMLQDKGFTVRRVKQ